jgi:two-component system response regulator AtoC
MEWNEKTVARPTVGAPVPGTHPATNTGTTTKPAAEPAGSAARQPNASAAGDANLNVRWKLGGMIGRSPAMERLFLQMRYLANHLRVALVEGEPGTGKLLAARTLHTLATKSADGFVPCSAKTFFQEGEATRALEEARGGTLYLTRVDTLTVQEQGKLLQLLEWLQHQQTRNGGQQTPRQVLVSCERPLRGLVLQGTMRADLCYHLTSVRLLLPPLRERRDDLPLLVEHFMEQFSRRHGKPLRGLGPGVLPHLLAHSWPGNVRELETTISSAALLCEGQWLRLIDLPLLSLANPQEGISLVKREGSEAASGSAGAPAQDPNDPNLDRAIVRHIRHVLASVNGNKLRAARLLGISRSTLYRLLDASDVAVGE